jgi:hypothetical protein
MITAVPAAASSRNAAARCAQSCSREAGSQDHHGLLGRVEGGQLAPEEISDAFVLLAPWPPATFGL